MLSYLHVKNIALIDDLEIEFSHGLNIITGETGAGKSILIGSINAVLGNAIAKDFIKHGANSAQIDLLFNDYNPLVNIILTGYDIDTDEQLIISRKIGERSVFRINGQIVNSKVVKQVSDILLDIHSQHEHQSLLDEKQHILLLDRFLGEKINKVLDTYKKNYVSYQKVLKSLKETGENQDAFIREIEFLEYEIAEIESHNIDLDEDQLLETRYKRLQKSKEIIQTLNVINQSLLGSDYQVGVTDLIDSGLKDMAALSMDQELLEIHDQLEGVSMDVSEVIHSIQAYILSLDIDSGELSEMAMRIDTLNKLRMKYGMTLSDVVTSLTEKKDALHKLLNIDQYRQDLLIKKDTLEKTLQTLASELSVIRRQGSKTIEKSIEDELIHLNLADAKFSIDIKQKSQIGIDGIDNVRFMINTNLGQSLKPLKHVASGGEVSRVMLAIKAVTAQVDMIDTMIFDEIDAGISGKTAGLVGDKLSDVSRSRQIIAITHLPQIASMADSHFKVEKNNQNQTTSVQCYLLDQKETTYEIGRLLGGKNITDVVLENASEMLKLANEYKKTY